jgi:hypothetical protein
MQAFVDRVNLMAKKVRTYERQALRMDLSNEAEQKLSAEHDVLVGEVKTLRADFIGAKITSMPKNTVMLLKKMDEFEAILKECDEPFIIEEDEDLE